MNTQQLQCFLYVADRLSFTKAADDLYLSVPTVTHHIKSLEEELNTKLFFRTRQIVRLTEAGTIFYEDAKEIFNKIMFTQQRLQDIAKQELKFLTIGYSSNYELEELTDAVTAIHQEFPRLRCPFTITDPFTLRHLFESGQLHLILSSYTASKDIKDCSFQKIKTFQNYALVPPEHKLWEKAEITLEELKEHCIITLHPRLIPFYTDQKLQKYLLFHVQDHADLICENEAVSMLMAKCGYGVCILPDILIPSDLKDLKVLPIRDVQKLDYGITFRHNNMEQQIQYFLDYFK